MASILERNNKVAKAKEPKKTREDYAEDALYREVWEEVNNDKTQAFIKKYSRHMIIGALVLLIIVTAVQIGVRAHRNAKIAVATNYETAVMNMDANALAAIAGDSSGATADLAMFQSYLIDNDIKKLEQLAAHGATRDFRDLAKMHIVANRGDEMSATDVEKYLSDLDTKKSPFYYTSRLTIAQKYLATGDKAAADKWLNVIINDKDAPAVVSATAQSLR